ncbi:hypothetical protein GCM10010462_02920 [Microbacterium dextranolyticum]
MTEPCALLYVDASIIALPGVTAQWIDDLNDLVDHVAENRYALEVTALLPPRVSRTVRVRALALHADALGTGSATPHSRVSAIALDVHTRRPRRVVQAWWLTADPGPQRPLLERAGATPLRILNAQGEVDPPPVEDIEEVLIGWTPPVVVPEPETVDVIYVRESALPDDLTPVISLSHQAALHGIALFVDAPRGIATRNALRDAGISLGLSRNAPANIARLVWVSASATRESTQDRRLAPFADEVLPVRPPRDAAGWDALIARLVHA